MDSYLSYNSIWFHPALFVITSLTVLLQLYVLWLTMARLPKEMRPFRFALCLFTFFDMAFTVHLGFVLDPELLVPLAKGAFVSGLARVLGPNGGRIGFGLTIAAGAAMLSAQVYALMFRATAIQQHFAALHERFNRAATRAAFLALGMLICCGCGTAAFCTLAAPEEIIPVLRSRHHFEAVLPVLQQHNSSVLILLNMDSVAGTILPILLGGGFAIAQLFSLAFSVLIYRTLRANSHCFSARTYQLHRQLTALLIVQFCLPILFVVGPASAGLLAILWSLPVTRSLGDSVLLLFNVYAFSNTSLTLLFITPFRNQTKLLLRWPLRFLVKAQIVHSSVAVQPNHNLNSTTKILCLTTSKN